MSEYYLGFTGEQLDDAINKVRNNYIDKSKMPHFATGVVQNITAGQKMTVTGIKDSSTGEAFTPKGVLAYVEVEENSTIFPANHKYGTPAIFCFIRDFDRNFGVGMACYSAAENVANLREVRFNSDIGGVSSPSNDYISVNGNSFTYKSVTSTMWGLLEASAWRWVAWA